MGVPSKGVGSAIVLPHHADGVNLPALFAAPEPVPLSVHSNLSRGDVLDRLDRSIGGQYRTDGRPVRYVVLRGSTAAGQVNLTAQPYVTPEVRAKNRPSVQLRGVVVPTMGGSEIQAVATAPVRWTTTALLAFALVAWALIGISGGLVTGAFALVVGPFVVVAWTLMLRRNQRMALLGVNELVRTLESIVSAE